MKKVLVFIFLFSTILLSHGQIPSRVLSPVDGQLSFSTGFETSPGCTQTNTKWCFWQWGANGCPNLNPNTHCLTGINNNTGHGVDGAFDNLAFDCNLSADADNGRDVFAVADGWIQAFNGWGRNGSGQFLIKHKTNNGHVWYSSYLHMTNIIGKTNNKFVKKGERIGTISNVGADGINHLHFGVYINDNNVLKTQNPVDGLVERGIISSNQIQSCFATINDDLPFLCGFANTSNTITIRFKINGTTFPTNGLSNTSIQNFKINNVDFGATITNFTSIGNGEFSFKTTVPANSFIPNTHHDVIFNIVNGTQSLKAYKEQVMFFSPPLNINTDKTWYKNFVNDGIKWGILLGSFYNQDSVAKSLTRGEAIKLICLASFKLRVKTLNVLTVTNPAYSDVDGSNPYFPYIQTWKNISLSSQNTFRPNDFVTLGELARFLYIMFELPQGNSVKSSSNAVTVDTALDDNIETALNSLLNTFVVDSSDPNGRDYVERLNTNLDNGSTLIINDAKANQQISKAKIAKALVNTYKYKFRALNQNTFPSNARMAGTNALTDFSVVGYKFELTTNPYGSQIPPQTLAPKTLVSGQIKDFSFPDVTIGGLPVQVYWCVDGGTLAPIGSAPLFQSVKFTAPTVSSQTTYHLYYYVATSGGYAQEFFQDIIVNPSGTPPADNSISVQLSSNSLDFGSIAVNTTSDRTLTVTNPSTSTGSLVGGFNMQLGTAFTLLSGPINFNLTPGQSVTYQFRFQPTSGGSFSLPFLLNHNGKNYSTPVSVNLTGTATVASGGGGSVTCTSATAITCGNLVSSTTVGGTSQAASYGTLPFIFNGNEKVYSFSPTATGPHKIEFSGDALGKMRLFILTNCANTSTYTADVSGVEWVNLNAGFIYYFIVDGFDNTSGSFSLKVSNCPNTSGTALNDCIASSHSNIDYGLELTGSTRQASFTIRNRTGNYLEFAFNITGPDASLFSISGSNTYLNGLETKTYTVYWNVNPNGSSYQRAVLNVTAANCSIPIKINLQGKVIPTFNFTKPVGGEVFYLGADPDNIINWTTDAGATQYDTQFSVDGGVTWINNGEIYGNGTSSYVFDGNACTSKGKIRMRLPLTESWYESNGHFTIRQKRYSEQIFLTNPVGNELLKGGQVIRIAWEDYSNSGLNKTVKISYDGGSTYQIIASNLTQNYFDWTVPYFTIDKNNCYIMVTDGSHDDANNCSFRIIATQAPPLNFTYTITQPTCNVTSNGVITLSVMGGTSPYSYEWKKGAVIVGGNSATLSSAGVGNYEFQITDATGNIKTGLVYLSATNFTVTPAVISATCSKNNGSASLSVSPTGSYTYNWGSGIATSTLSNQTGGTYTVRVTQQPTGCYQDVSVTIPASLSNVTVNIPQPSTVCFGNTISITAAPTGGTAPYTYSWSSGGNTQTVALGAGSYQSVVTDANGCQGSNNVIVSGYAQTIGGVLSPQSQTICQNVGTINTLLPEVFTLSGYTGNILRWEYKSPTGSWTNWNSAGSTTSGNCCFGTAIGNWKVRAVVRDATNNCPEAYSAEGDVIVMPTPTAVLSGNQTINTGQTANITVNFTGSGPWSFVLNGQTYSDILTSPYLLSVAPTSTTSYSLTSMTGICGIGITSGNAVVTINTVCTQMYTLKTGNWNDVTVWSCGRVPTSTDVITVKANHIITIPASYTANAKDVNYETGGKISSIASTSNLCLSCTIIPTNGLMLYLPLNGNANDASGNGLNGSIVGSITSTTDRKGIINSAYQFSGIALNYISIPDNALLCSNIITLNAWVNFAPSEGGYIINKGRDIQNGSYRLTSGGVAGQVLYNGVNDASYTSVPTNQWVMVTGVINGNNAKYYVNGVMVSQATLSSSYVCSSAGNPLTIGNHYYNGVPDFWAYPYKGKIDDIRIYNRALSDAEVLQIYNGEK